MRTGNSGTLDEVLLELLMDVRQVLECDSPLALWNRL